MRIISAFILMAIMPVSVIAAADNDEIIKGVSEFLIDRAADNAMYVFERKTRENPFFRVFFPNTCDYLSNASFRQLFLSKDLLKKKVDKDVVNILRESSLIYMTRDGPLPTVDTSDLSQLLAALDSYANVIDRDRIVNAIEDVKRVISGTGDTIEINGELFQGYPGLNTIIEKRKNHIIKELYKNPEDVSTCRKELEYESKSISMHYGILLASIREVREVVAEEISKIPALADKETLETYLRNNYFDTVTRFITRYYTPADSDIKNRVLKLTGAIDSIVELTADKKNNAVNSKKPGNFELVLEAEKYISELFSLSSEEADKKEMIDSVVCFWCGDREQLKRELADKYSLDYKQTGSEYRHFRKSILFLAQLSDADSKEQVKELLETAMLPSISFGEKRTPGQHNLFLSAYFGLSYVENEVLPTENHLNIFVPVGLDYSYGLAPGHWLGEGNTLGVMLGILDMAVPVNLSLQDRDEDVELEDILYPGLYVNYGLRNHPLTMGIGVSRGKVAGGLDEKDTRYMIFMALDMPLLSLF